MDSSQPRRVYVNGKFLAQETTGVQRFAQEIVRAWDMMIDARDIDDRRILIEVLAPRSADTSFRLSHIKIRRIGTTRGQVWEQVELPWHARNGILFSPCTVGPVVKSDQVVVIHDAIFLDMPENYSRAFLAWYRAVIPALCHRAARIVTVSDYSKERLMNRLGLAESRISLVSEGSEHLLRTNADPEVVRRLGLTPGRFVLAVGSLKPVKNFKMVTAAWAMLEDLDLDLVIAGSANPRVFGETTLEARKRMHLIGRASDGILRALYEQALCLTFPSLLEGFGLPIVEAMASGCPVITSANGAISEVAGDAALYCDARSPEDLARKVRALATDPSLQQTLRDRGHDRVRAFTWKRNAQILLDTILDVAEPRSIVVAS